VIQDIDAGIGRVDQMTQYTVNTQLVNGTLAEHCRHANQYCSFLL
jgi:hypothetical protein